MIIVRFQRGCVDKIASGYVFSTGVLQFLYSGGDLKVNSSPLSKIPDLEGQILSILFHLSLFITAQGLSGRAGVSIVANLACIHGQSIRDRIRDHDII